MARYWPGRSLLELYRGEMSWRELRVFLRYLPPESATARAIGRVSAADAQWTLDRQLLAAAVDAIREGTFAAVKLGGDPKKTGRLKPPQPIPRPGVEPVQQTSNVIRFGGRHGSGAKQLAGLFGGPAATR
ncbi:MULTISPECIES: hypothetical protein [unclassified Streptomyces]|uniref:hypothetical protein n=1 Tax=unclassified Streptomyces TaxID=2593676 RepID=UPI00081E22DC|nr:MULTISPECIES: hypothetical protein [unclassified Streptomyces]MYR29811.1 hypothetical protein [Streptomyces sp. SID4945]SCF47720.1 hypothetical protein GA0115257_119120 [Streptomyces sp. LcepLS]